MVLASWMILPGTDDAIHIGLGLLPDLLVLPHYQQERDDVVTTLRERVAADVTILALPACSGVMTSDDRLFSLGGQDCWRYDATGERTAVPRE